MREIARQPERQRQADRWLGGWGGETETHRQTDRHRQTNRVRERERGTERDRDRERQREDENKKKKRPDQNNSSKARI